MKKIINPWRNHPEYNCFGCCPENPIGLHMEFFAGQSGKAERYEDGDYIVSTWHSGTHYHTDHSTGAALPCRGGTDTRRPEAKGGDTRDTFERRKQTWNYNLPLKEKLEWIFERDQYDRNL